MYEALAKRHPKLRAWLRQMPHAKNDQRDALVAKRRVLMADWADFCASDRAANVVRMDGGRQRPTPRTDDQSTIVGGIEFPNSESAASR